MDLGLPGAKRHARNFHPSDLNVSLPKHTLVNYFAFALSQRRQLMQHAAGLQPSSSGHPFLGRMPPFVIGVRSSWLICFTSRDVHG
jgi:hypothetical protein